MAAYVFFGKYSQEALKGISPKRTDKAASLIKKSGGELKSGYILLGDVDLILIAEMPGNEQAVMASIALARELGIGFKTAPAISVADFDKLMAK
jgi:uncharacterized protein with GYD domain